MGGEEQYINLFSNFLFCKIFRTFRMAIQPGKLILAFSALAVICFAGWVMDFSRTVVATPGTGGRVTELQAYMSNPAQVNLYIENYKQIGDRAGVFSTLWDFCTTKFHDVLNALFAFNLPAVAANIADYFRALGWALTYHPVYSIILILIELAIIAVAGGAICRLAALQFARGEKPGVGEALHFSSRKFFSLFATPLVPVLIIAAIGFFLLLIGLIGNIRWFGELIVALSVCPALIAGMVAAFLIIGVAAGFNLMFPSIAYDGSDCFDAISRSFSYVYSRPWQMGFYSAVAVIYGALCYVFVRFFAFLLLWAPHRFLPLGIWAQASSKQADKLVTIWPEPRFMRLYGTPGWAEMNWSELVAAFIIHLLCLVIIGLLVAFLISFYFSANTIIYSLLRKCVDNTALDEVYIHSNVVKTEPVNNKAASQEAEPESQA
ncbi:MAG: hypothetical protein ACYS8Y_13325, partial [Planctomycetota bacterium]